MLPFAPLVLSRVEGAESPVEMLLRFQLESMLRFMFMPDESTFPISSRAVLSILLMPLLVLDDVVSMERLIEELVSIECLMDLLESIAEWRFMEVVLLSASTSERVLSAERSRLLRSVVFSPVVPLAVDLLVLDVYPELLRFVAEKDLAFSPDLVLTVDSLLPDPEVPVPVVPVVEPVPVVASLPGLVVVWLVLPDAELVPPSPALVAESPMFRVSEVEEFTSAGGADCVVSVSEPSLLFPEPPQLARNMPGASSNAATHCFDHFIFIRFID